MAAEYGSRAYFFAHLVNLFLTTVDREYGTIIMLPYGEPLMEHPESTRTAWLIMQDVLLQKIVADRKAATPKGLSSRGKVRL